jgi:hypothetical protein
MSDKSTNFIVGGVLVVLLLVIFRLARVPLAWFVLGILSFVAGSWSSGLVLLGVGLVVAAGSAQQ